MRQTFLVGGAVRDKLLGREVKDRDWVVTGATPEEMLSKGFTQVGKDFPVFLHPETREEYALARTERKTGSGHHGFDLDFNPDITIVDDLMRRDLTINAMAEDHTGQLIDPSGGLHDIEDQVLRPVSEAFKEDPMRVLRTFRFLARFGPGWKVDDSVHHMAFEMLALGEFDKLSKERFLQELMKAMDEEHWFRFFSPTVLSILAHRFGHHLSFIRQMLPSKDQTTRWSELANTPGAVALLTAMGASNKTMQLLHHARALRSFKEHGMVSALSKAADKDLASLSTFLDAVNEHTLNHKMHELWSNLRFEHFNDSHTLPEQVRARLEDARKTKLRAFHMERFK